jgi:hypothetical protein
LLWRVIERGQWLETALENAFSAAISGLGHCGAGASRFALEAKKGYNLEVAGRAAFICVPGATTWLSEKMGVSPIFFWFGRLCSLLLSGIGRHRALKPFITSGRARQSGLKCKSARSPGARPANPESKEVAGSLREHLEWALCN